MGIKFSHYLRLVRFDKPIGTLLLLWPTLWALVLAAKGYPPLYLLIVFSLGVFLTRSAGCAINDYLDSDFDRHVERTKNRPLASGVISKAEALVIFVILSLIAFILAYVFLQPKTLLLTIPALLIYASYPLMKRLIPIPQAYLAIAYSCGIPMAYMEIKSYLDLTALLIIIANMFWILGYDTIYAMVDKDDDLKIGIKTSAITFGRFVNYYVSGFYLLFILSMAVVAKLEHLSLVFWVFWILCAILLIQQIIVIGRPDKAKWFKMFLLNNRVGYLMLLAISCGYWF